MLKTALQIYRNLFSDQIYKKIWLVIGYLDIVQTYRQSFLGPLWISLSVGIQALSITYIYTQLFNEAGNTGYYGYVVCGLISWSWISGLLTEMGNVFITYSNYIKTSSININQLVWAMAWKHSIIFLHNLVLWFCFFIVGQINITIYTLYIFITFPILFISSIPIIGILGLLYARYRDIQKLVASLLTILLLVTPIFWHVEKLTGARKYIFQLNPFYYMIQSIRDPLMGNSITESNWWFLIMYFILSWTLAASLFIFKSRNLVFWL